MSVELWMSIGIVFLSSIIQAGTGFGFSILAMPLLSSVLPIHEAVQINLLLTWGISIAMVRSIRKEYNSILLKRWALSGVVGIPLGALILLWVPTVTIKLVLALAILVAGAFLFGKSTWGRNRLGDHLSGFLSGFLTGAVGVPGPPLLAYTVGIRMDKGAARNTTLVYYIVIYFLAIVTQWMMIGITKSVWVNTLILIIPTIIGMLLGHLLFRWISQTLFRYIQLTTLLFTGIYLVVSGLS